MHISTSMVPATGQAVAVFALAQPPTGSTLHEAIFAARLAVTGGSTAAESGPLLGRTTSAATRLGRTSF